MNLFLTIAISIWIYMSVWFILSAIVKRNDIVDIAWGIGFVLISYLSLLLSTPNLRSAIVCLLITIWGTRLSLHIYHRVKNRPEDFRYLNWRKQWKHFFLRSYLQIYLLQGSLMFLVSMPVILINHRGSQGITTFDVIGLFVWVFGFYFESTSDRQLRDFISIPQNKGKIMDKGLWRFSRHPNYFGEVTQWWGIYLFSLSLSGATIAIVGPITITFLILFVSGIPLLEKKYAGRQDFEIYKKKTSVFIPLPPRSV